MRRLAGQAYKFLLICGAALAQTPAGAPSNVMLDTPLARVILGTEQPHKPSAMHEHTMNRVMVYLGAGTMTFQHSSGKTDTLTVKAGEAVWSPASGQHISEAVSDKPFQVIEIELKNKPNPGMTMPPLDPLKVDPKHYKLEFENDQVRVLRVRFGPKEKGVQHEHKLPHIVVYLTDQARGKAGEVRFDEAMTHTEENPLDHAVERLAIDLK